MTKKRVLYGVASYEELVKDNGYFVDKTKYLESLEAVKNPVFLRPRRFGKSLWCSILEHYYAVQHKDRFEELFASTYIYQNPTPNRGSYLVLRFDFSVVEVHNDLESIEESFNHICYGKMELFLSRYKSFFKKPPLLDPQKSASHNLEQILLKAEENQTPPLYLIIDEYDNFANQLIIRHEDQLYRKLTSDDGFLKTFFKVIKAGRGTSTIANTFITGVLPVTIDDLTSAYNIATFLTLRSSFASMLGYTQAEVDTLISQIYEDYELPVSTMQEVKNLIKNHYNGYCFVSDSETLYNPTILSYFLSQFTQDTEIPEFLTDENLKTDISWIYRLTGGKPELTKELVQQLVLEGTLPYNRMALKEKFNMHQFFQKDYFSISFFYLGMLSIKNIGLMRVPNTNMHTIIMEYFNELHQIDVSTKYADMMLSFADEPNIEKLFSDYWELYLSQFPEDIFQQVNENFYRSSFYALCNQFLSSLYTWNVERSYPEGKSDLEFVGKYHTPFAGQRHLLEFKYISNAECKKQKIRIKSFKLRPEDTEQLEGYAKGLKAEYPEASIRKYVVYCFGNKGFRLFEIS